MSMIVTVTGSNLKPVTDPIVDWSDIDLLLKFNEVGAGSFTAPASPRLLDACSTPGNRVAVHRNGQVAMSGPIEKPGVFRWSASNVDGVGVVTVAFADNNVCLAERISYPNPALAATAQDIDFWIRTGVNAEVVARELVNLNAGVGALAPRRVPLLDLGAVAGVGGPVNVTTRFESLTEVLRYVCSAGGGLGFRVREQGGALRFEVYAPVDRSKSIVFSRALGNLSSLETNPEAPVATVAIVGGTGEGASRIVVERAAGTAATWGRKEIFVNQSGVADGIGLAQYGDEALLDKGEKVGLTANPIDGPNARYGDYNLGDRVGVVLANGVLITDVIRAVQIKGSPTGGETITPVIGTTDSTTDAGMVGVVRDMLRRLGRLERT